MALRPSPLLCFPPSTNRTPVAGSAGARSRFMEKPMQLQTVPLSSLLPPKGNPRRTLDTAIIAGLAQSIRADGLLQNLVVCPTEDDNYRVIAGKRRYLALQLLKKQGVIDGDYGVPVEIRSDLADDDMLRIATVENVQREPLPPMEEAEAFAKLLQHGGKAVSYTHLTLPTIYSV